MPRVWHCERRQDLTLMKTSRIWSLFTTLLLVGCSHRLAPCIDQFEQCPHCGHAVSAPASPQGCHRCMQSRSPLSEDVSEVWECVVGLVESTLMFRDLHGRWPNTFDELRASGETRNVNSSPCEIDDVRFECPSELSVTIVYSLRVNDNFSTGQVVVDTPPAPIEH